MRIFKLLAVHFVEAGADRKLTELSEVACRRYPQLEKESMEVRIAFHEALEGKKKDILVNKEKWTKRILGVEG